MKVDIKHFKRLHADKEKTVLQHPDGHQIVIAHEHLTPKMRGQVAALPEAEHMKSGGSVLAQDSGEFAPAVEEPQQAEEPVLQGASPSLSMGAVDSAPTNGQGLAPQPQTPPQQSDPWGTQGLLNETEQGIDLQKKGLQQTAMGQSQQGQEEAKALDQGLKQQQAIMDHFNQANQQIESERQGFMNDLKNEHIDPNQYLSNMSGGQKIGTAIGLILGGIGGGLTGQENPAMKFLQSQIDRNIEGQKSNLGIKNKLLEANRQHFQDEKSATDMTRVMMNDMLSHKIQLAAAKSTDPIVQGRAQQALGVLEAQNAPLLAQIKARKAVLGGMQQGSIDPAMGVRFLVPEHQQAAAYNEVKAAQGMMKGKEGLLSGFNIVKKENTLGNRALHFIDSGNRIDAAWEPNLAQLIKDSEGRITPQDTPMINSMKPSMGESDSVRRFKQQRLESFINQKMNFPILDSYGINPVKNNMGKKIQESAPIGK